MVFYYKFSIALSKCIKDKAERDEFIFKYLIHSVCEDMSVNLLIKKRIEAETGYEGYDNFLCYDFVRDYDKVKEILSGMRFDVVVGNPPYNKDIYLKFVMKGFELSSNYTLMITPAKFWAKSTCDSDIEFRKLIKMSGITFVVYKDCKEVFDISEPGGVAYYLLQKNKSVTGYNIKCNHRTSIAFQSDFELHSDLEFLPLAVLNILYKFGESDFKSTLNLSENFYIDRIVPDDTGNITIVQGAKVYGFIDSTDLKTLCGLDKYKCIQNCMCGSGAFQSNSSGAFLGMPPITILKPYEIGKGSYHHLRFFDTLDEAEHFIEFMSTKLVNFAYVCGLCGTTNSAEFYRYIPMQDNFNCIYEDKPLDGYTPNADGEYLDNQGNKHCSLYIKYKLTADEINIIESVIRGR